MKEFKTNRLWAMIVAAFLLLLFIFDKNNLVSRWHLNQEINELKQQKEYYINKIAEDSLTLENLKNDVFLEKYARERYLMKRKSETIYILK